jgi:hypothetical protein
MQITPELIRMIYNQFQQPTSYTVTMDSIIPHDRGIVVTYTVKMPARDGMAARTEYRCAGFVLNKHARDGLLGKFDMIVS